VRAASEKKLVTVEQRKIFVEILGTKKVLDFVSANAQHMQYQSRQPLRFFCKGPLLTWAIARRNITTGGSAGVGQLEALWAVGKLVRPCVQERKQLHKQRVQSPEQGTEWDVHLNEA
jgi:hypothetical protein